MVGVAKEAEFDFVTCIFDATPTLFRECGVDRAAVNERFLIKLIDVFPRLLDDIDELVLDRDLAADPRLAVIDDCSFKFFIEGTLVGIFPLKFGCTLPICTPNFCGVFAIVVGGSMKLQLLPAAANLKGGFLIGILLPDEVR